MEKLQQARMEVQTFLESQEKHLHDVLQDAGVALEPQAKEKLEGPEASVAGKGVVLDVEMEIAEPNQPQPTSAAASSMSPEQSQAAEKAQQLQERLIPAFQKILTGIDDAIRFAQQMDLTVPVMCELLASKAKSEVLETMDFFVTLHRSGLESAREGLRRMIHLVWNKDANSEEGRTVKSSLMECFHQVYIASSDGEQDKISAIVRNLIG